MKRMRAAKMARALSAVDRPGSAGASLGGGGMRASVAGSISSLMSLPVGGMHSR